MHTDFVLSQADGRPMYLQIIDEVNRRVALGDWPPGHKLPSIRELAVVLSVSVITVKRAYLELERAGLIVTQQGKGSWVSEQIDVSDVRMAELEKHLQQTLRLAQSMGLSKTTLIELLDSYTQQGELR